MFIFSYVDYSNFFTLSQSTHTRDHHLNYLSHLPIIYVTSNFGTRVINDWNNLTSDTVTNSLLNSVKSAVDNYFHDFSMFHI